MQIAYPGCFVAIVGEACIREMPLGPSFIAGACLFTLAKTLKYWAIATLGPRWTFRVLVPPGQPLIAGGPYRLTISQDPAEVSEMAGSLSPRDTISAKGYRYARHVLELSTPASLYVQMSADEFEPELILRAPDGEIHTGSAESSSRAVATT